MLVQRVSYGPQKEVYNPGDVLSVAVYFGKRFVGQCELALVRRNGAAAAKFSAPPSVFARSGPALYEGQVHVSQEHVGRCVLLARLTPVDEPPVLLEIGDRIFQVQRIRP